MGFVRALGSLVVAVRYRITVGSDREEGVRLFLLGSLVARMRFRARQREESKGEVSSDA